MPSGAGSWAGNAGAGCFGIFRNSREAGIGRVILDGVYRERDVGRRGIGTSKEVDVVLRALAHPFRRAAIEMLVERDTDATEFTIVAGLRFGLAESTASEHLRVLREAGLVRRRAEGSCRVFTLALEAPDLLASWAESVVAREPGRWVPYEVEG